MTTRVADVIQPEVWVPYVINRTMELSALVQSGIVTNNSEFDQLASGPNTLVNMPYFNDLEGRSEVMNTNSDLTPGKIGTGQDVAKKHGRARAWGSEGLAALLSGADPAAAIGDLAADYWQREMQYILVSTLKGVFTAASMAQLTLDISALTGGAELIEGASFIDAGQLLGDAKGLLTAVAMHSAVEAYLAKQKLIEYVQEADQSDRVPYYMGKRVIVDDGLPFDTGAKTADTFLFGEGAFALGNGSHPKIVPVETARDALASSGEDYLINRKIFILHPRGIKWTEAAVAGEFPTDAEIETGTNWQRVYDVKKIRIVRFRHKIA